MVVSWIEQAFAHRIIQKRIVPGRRVWLCGFTPGQQAEAKGENKESFHVFGWVIAFLKISRTISCALARLASGMVG